MIKKCFTAFILLIMAFSMTACTQRPVDTLTYAVFPYLPDVEYYQEIIETRWAEIEPDIRLVRADWDCYTDGKPEGIDVVMFDAVMRDKIVESGWIQSIDPSEVDKIEDIYPFALEGSTVNGKLYGIPVFLCGNFLIYDQDNEALAKAEHITDLEGMSEILVVNSEFSNYREQYTIEATADTLGDVNPSIDDSDNVYMQPIDDLTINKHKHDDNMQVAKVYDSGVGQGYIGFSESMRFLENRVNETQIRTISFGDQENIFRLYVDNAALTAGVKGQRYEKCLELMNVMAEADVLTKVSVQKGVPQYLMLARKSAYPDLINQFELYAQIEKLASNEKNNTILTP